MRSDMPDEALPVSTDEIALRVYCFLRTWYGNADWFEPYEPLGFGTAFIPIFIAEGVRERLIPLMDRFGKWTLKKAATDGLALSPEERKQKANLIAPMILGGVLPTNVKAEFVDVIVQKERRITQYIDPKPKPDPPALAVETDCSNARPIAFED